MEKPPQPTKRLIERLRRHARKLQALVPRQTQEDIPVIGAVLRAIANTNWQAAARLEDAFPYVRMLASQKCYEGEQGGCGQCGPCLANTFLADIGDAPVPPARDLNDVAREVCHAEGLPWTDPRTGRTFPPPVPGKPKHKCNLCGETCGGCEKPVYQCEWLITHKH